VALLFRCYRVFLALQKRLLSALGLRDVIVLAESRYKL